MLLYDKREDLFDKNSYLVFADIYSKKKDCKIINKSKSISRRKCTIHENTLRLLHSARVFHCSKIIVAPKGVVRKEGVAVEVPQFVVVGTAPEFSQNNDTLSRIK